MCSIEGEEPVEGGCIFSLSVFHKASHYVLLLLAIANIITLPFYVLTNATQHRFGI